MTNVFKCVHTERNLWSSFITLNPVFLSFLNLFRTPDFPEYILFHEMTVEDRFYNGKKMEYIR